MPGTLNIKDEKVRMVYEAREEGMKKGIEKGEVRKAIAIVKNLLRLNLSEDQIELINDITFLCETRVKSTYFTRAGKNKMDFTNIFK